ncbi:gamma-glutamylcyclotransferase family protein [Streptomyces hokutonensis]|uniref:Gamma-glutamylcyclotransferase family protein n=1 Tax=Streptomyces hokutonensis TaxID=1306990 RepID=A0ABW6ME96_9ACTN
MLRHSSVLQCAQGPAGRIPDRVPASAPGYRAAALQGRIYPGLIVCGPGGSAPGLVLTDLSSDEWIILDAFEDERYDLCEIALSTGKLGLAYVWPGGDIRPEDWDAKDRLPVSAPHR